jgi:5'-3' exonuclease
MGIPHFYKWLRDKGYRGVLRRSVPKYVSTFSLDANGIIHKCAQLVYAYGDHDDPRRRSLIEKADPRMLEAEFYNAISIKLQEILTQVRPQETLVIAIDGVAPQGKISQQRQRRFRSAMESGEKTVFDSNCITPGTDFMIRLDNYLQRWIISYQATLPPKVIYSSHMVPGEGEHKILDLMRSGEITGDGSHVLYGMDADLIMLSLIAPLSQISLMREDISDVIDIESLKDALREELKTPTAVSDFVVMIFTIGNDFLPHMPALENLDEAIITLMDVYKKTGKSLTTATDLDWDSMTTYLTNLAREEPRLLKAESIRDVKYPSRMLIAAAKRTEKIEEGGAMIVGKKITFETAFDYNTFRGAWYQNALTPRGQDLAIARYLLPEYNFGVTMDKVVDMCHQYLIGMAWVYNYYSKGTAAINSDYVYRYHHTPLMSDLASVLTQVKTVKGYMAHAGQVVLNPIHQLLSVLPLKSKNLLPREVTHLMTKDSPIADMYPETAVIERDGKNADWQGIVLIPFVEPVRVIEAVNTTTMFTVERATVYGQANNVVIIRDPEMAELDKQRKGFRQFLEQEKQRGRGRGGPREGGPREGGPREGGRGGPREGGPREGGRGGPREGGRGGPREGGREGGRGGPREGGRGRGGPRERGRGGPREGGRGGPREGGRGGPREGGRGGPREGGRGGYRDDGRGKTEGRGRSPDRPQQPQRTAPVVGLPPIAGMPPVTGLPPIAGLPPVAGMPPVTGLPPVAGMPPVTGLPPVAGLPPVTRDDRPAQYLGSPTRLQTQTSNWKKRTTIL